jgi:hypothetical protein
LGAKESIPAGTDDHTTGLDDKAIESKISALVREGAQ